MKKTYIQPTSATRNIQVRTMLAQSVAIQSAGGNGSVLGREDNNWDIWGGDDED